MIKPGPCIYLIEVYKMKDGFIKVAAATPKIKVADPAYNTEEILKKMSFTIKPNEKIAFVGATGAGKTTIFNLLCKLYNIDSGEITIDIYNLIKLAKFYNTSCDYLLGLTDISTPYTSIKNDNIR